VSASQNKYSLTKSPFVSNLYSCGKKCTRGYAINTVKTVAMKIDIKFAV